MTVEQTFRRKVMMLARLDAEHKAVKKEVDRLKADVKLYMGMNDLDRYDDGPVSASYQVQERVSMNDAKLIQKLKELGFYEAIKTVEVPDQGVIEELIYEGKLNAIELDECIERKEVTVLRIKGGDKLEPGNA